MTGDQEPRRRNSTRVFNAPGRASRCEGVHGVDSTGLQAVSSEAQIFLKPRFCANITPLGRKAFPKRASRNAAERKQDTEVGVG